MDPKQVRNAASPEEEALIREIAETKDALIGLMASFRTEAEALRATLRPHRIEVLRRPDPFSEREREEARRDAEHNIEVARPFAARWTLPFIPDLSVDPSYLVDRPFSGAPLIEGTSGVVTEWGSERLPLLVLHIDIRVSKDMLLKRIDARLDVARGRWEAGGGMFFPTPSKELKRYRTMRNVMVLRQEGKTQNDVAKRLKISLDYVQTLERQWREMEKKRTCWQIAPYTDPRWADSRRRAEADHVTEISRAGVPIRVRMND